MLQNPHPPAGIPPPRSPKSPPRRGGRNRIGGRTGIVGVSIGFRTPNHPGRSAPGRHPVGAHSHEEPRMNLHA